MEIIEKIKEACPINNCLEDIEPNVGGSERVLSAFSGGILFTSGIRKLRSHPRRSLFFMALGGALIWRGITGYCPAKNLVEKIDEEDPEYKVVERYYYK